MGVQFHDRLFDISYYKDYMMKLYFSKGACSLSIRICAHELGLNLEYEAVDLKAKKTASGKDYWAINTKGSVPALEIDAHTILTENIAILEYLADTHPSTLLPPVGKIERYRVLEWLSFAATDFHKAYSPLFNPNVTQDMKDAIFIPVLRLRLVTLEKALKGRKYLTGEHFTLPDAYCFVALRWLVSQKINISDYPEVHRFFNEVSERPAVRAALEEELK